MFEIDFKSLGRKFSVEEEETILDGALRNKIEMPFGCLSGNCGSCKGKVIDGSVDHGNAKPFVLSETEKEQGYALFCQATAKSDLIINTLTLNNDSPIVKKLPCRVQAIKQIAPDVIIMDLKLPTSHNFQFKPGQYVDILMKDGKRRSYSMANVSDDSKRIELHIRRMNKGRFTEYAFHQMKVKDILRFEGPLGNFCFDHSSEKPTIFLASGTGFAPIKSIIEQLFIDKTERQLTLYWGGRKPQDLYLQGLAEKWSVQHTNFNFIPVISDAKPTDKWLGRCGFVHMAVMDDHPSLKNYQVYACGAPEMVEAAQKDFTEKRDLPENHFFSDVFTPAP